MKIPWEKYQKKSIFSPSNYHFYFVLKPVAKPGRWETSGDTIIIAFLI
jgi:hypothetical protein